ncbi:hypothetical protein C7E17_26730, partial [Stenotrophomonas maltophilia]
SLLCGLAQSMGMLVLSRALQGFVAGPMSPDHAVAAGLDLSSLLCGLAQSMGMLVLSRALQGFVAGPMSPDHA